MIVPAQGDAPVVFGAIFEIEAGEKPLLDTVEGKGVGYEDCPLSCELAGESISPFTYLAQEAYIDEALMPYRWYLEMVVEGAKYQGFPSWYVAMLAQVSSISDPDAARHRENQARVTRMLACNQQRLR